MRVDPMKGKKGFGATVSLSKGKSSKSGVSPSVWPRRALDGLLWRLSGILLALRRPVVSQKSFDVMEEHLEKQRQAAVGLAEKKVGEAKYELDQLRTVIAPALDRWISAYLSLEKSPRPRSEQWVFTYLMDPRLMEQAAHDKLIGRDTTYFFEFIANEVSRRLLRELNSMSHYRIVPEYPPHDRHYLMGADPRWRG